MKFTELLGGLSDSVNDSARVLQSGTVIFSGIYIFCRVVIVEWMVLILKIMNVIHLMLCNTFI